LDLMRMECRLEEPLLKRVQQLHGFK
jgi:hypothetical protein